MPWSRIPARSGHARPGLVPGRGGPELGTEILVTDILDPVLVPLGFAPGQVGGVGDRGQVIFCRGEIDSPDGGCVDLVVDLEARPRWQVTDVRYWGLPSDRWHLLFDRRASLADQLAGLAQTLPIVLG
jgi:hypothetical protein